MIYEPDKVSYSLKELEKHKHLKLRNIQIGSGVLIVLILISVVIFLFTSTLSFSSTSSVDKLKKTGTSKIYLVQTNGNDYLLYSMNPDGSDMKIVVEKHFKDYDFNLSRDGKWLSFSELNTDRICVIKSDGSQIINIESAFGTDSAISPNGKKVAFVNFEENVEKNRDIYFKIYSFDILTKEIKLLKTGPKKMALFSDIQYTPDGKNIVYIGTENKKSNLFLIDAGSGAQIRTLTKIGYHFIESFDISADGNTIYFNSVCYDSLNKAHRSFLKLKMDGSEETKVLCKFDNKRENLIVSPDEKYLMFVESEFSCGNHFDDFIVRKMELETLIEENVVDSSDSPIFGRPLLWI